MKTVHQLKRAISALCMCGVLSMALTGCGSSGETTPDTGHAEQNAEVLTSETDTEPSSSNPDTADEITVRVGAMSGPTAMGLVKLMSDSEAGNTQNSYEFADLATDASAFVAPIAQGELDIAAVPANLASVLYQNTEGGVQILAVNNLGVLNIVERGEEIQQITDLKGKTIYATGQGATPEYTLRYLLQENGVDPDNDLTIQWCADTTEALSYVTTDESAVAMLPQPFVTVALSQVEDLRVAIDLNDVWEETAPGSSIVTGVIVVRREFAESHPQAVETFLEEYEASMEYTLNNPAEASALIESYGIVGKAALAEKALPGCHLQFMKGSEMKDVVSSYLDMLYEQNPASVGGNVPGDDFYYGL